jgi:hypothetical protein
LVVSWAVAGAAVQAIPRASAHTAVVKLFIAFSSWLHENVQDRRQRGVGRTDGCPSGTHNGGCTFYNSPTAGGAG